METTTKCFYLCSSMHREKLVTFWTSSYFMGNHATNELLVARKLRCKLMKQIEIRFSNQHCSALILSIDFADFISEIKIIVN